VLFAPVQGLVHWHRPLDFDAVLWLTVPMGSQPIVLLTAEEGVAEPLWIVRWVQAYGQHAGLVVDRLGGGLVCADVWNELRQTGRSTLGCHHRIANNGSIVALSMAFPTASAMTATRFACFLLRDEVVRGHHGADISLAVARDLRHRLADGGVHDLRRQDAHFERWLNIPDLNVEGVCTLSW